MSNEEWKRFYYNDKPTNYIVSSFGRFYNTKKQHFINGTYKTNEYHKVQLWIENKPISFNAHRLVAQLYCSNPYGYDIVDHIDGELIRKYSKIIDAAKGINCTDRAISSAANRIGTCAGYFWSFSKIDKTQEEIKELIRNNKVRSDAYGVTRYDLDGSNPKHYVSLREAKNDNGCSASTISRGAKAYRKAKGHYWILDNQNITIDELLSQSK